MKLFYQDVREKKCIAANAHKKYRPNKVPQINNYTEKELNGMNGVLNTYNLKGPMSWADFKAMPETIQKEYVEKHIKKYEIGPNALATMFGVSGPVCSNYLKNTLGVTVEGRSSAKKKDKFLAAMARQEAKAEATVESPDVEDGTTVPDTAQKSTVSPRPTAMSLPEATLRFQGPFSPADLANSLSALYAPGTKLDIHLKIAILPDEALGCLPRRDDEG